MISFVPGHINAPSKTAVCVDCYLQDSGAEAVPLKDITKRITELELNEPNQGAISLFTPWPAILARLQGAGVVPLGGFRSHIAAASAKGSKRPRRHQGGARAPATRQHPPSSRPARHG